MDLNRDDGGQQQKVYPMTYPFNPHCAANRKVASAEWSLLAFLDERRAALLSAGKLLGGKDGLSLVQGLYDRISSDGLAAGGVRRRLAALLALLSLQNVGDPDRVESACFAEIDIPDPRIEEICMLTDELGRLMAAIAGKPVREAATETA